MENTKGEYRADPEENIEEIIESPSLMSDQLFNQAFKYRPDRAELLIRDTLELMGIKNYEIISADTLRIKIDQETYDTTTIIKIKLDDDRIITVDVFLESDVEQTYRISRIAERESLLDGPYTDFPDRIIIFLSENDLLQNGRNFTTIVNCDAQTKKPINIGPKIVYINAENKDPDYPQITYLMEELQKSNYREAEDPIVKQILCESEGT